MRCRACNSRNTRVITTDKRYIDIVYRYCRCLDCNVHYKTTEKYTVPKPGTKPGSKTKSKFQGSTNLQSVLTENNVIELRKMYKEGTTRLQLAQIFGISPQHVSRIVKRQRWTHV